MTALSGPVIETKNPSFLEVGPRYSSIPFTTNSLVAGTPLPIFQGFGFGFIILLARDAPHTPTLKIRILGVGKNSNQYMYVTPNVWYDGPFAGLQVEANDQLPSTVLDAGYWVCNIALKSDARAFPSTPDAGINGIPAAGGGNPQASVVDYSVVFAGVEPTILAQTGSVPIGANGQAESMWRVYVEIYEEVFLGTISGGGIDIWRYDSANQYQPPQWTIAVQNIPLITGYRKCSIPVDYFGPRYIGDRIYATPSKINPITVTQNGGSSTNVLISTVVQ